MLSKLIGPLLLAAQLSNHSITVEECTTLHCPPPGVSPGGLFEAPRDEETYKSSQPGSFAPDTPNTNDTEKQGSGSKEQNN